MKSKNVCPFCQEKVIQIISSNQPARVGKQAECDNCGASGPIYETEKDALSGWNLGIVDFGKRLRTVL